jgi:UDP-N-acetylmuramoylalanine--D-glutamate ligase
VDGVLHRGAEALVAVAELRIHGSHNVANALAACALAGSVVPLPALAAGLRSFKGLPHRVELVAARRGVEWYDDSKGTNVGATIAALNGLAKPAILILGGDGKGQDFAPLRAPVAKYGKKALLIGRDAPLIERALSGLPVERCGSLEEAVQKAAREAAAGDVVLLSPACASFDMFRDYKHRGEAFAAAVQALPA